jgi:hypothetical protein
MAHGRTRYYFGRLNLITGDNDKVGLLRKALASDAVLAVRGQRWGFYEFRELEDPSGLFMSGYLVKYNPEAEEEIVIPERHALEDKAVENKVMAKSRFFLHASSGLIVYHPVGGQISRKLFPRRFVQVFEDALANFFVNADIQSIEEEYSFEEMLKSFTFIREVSIHLHPSNPSSRDIWQNVDRRMKELNASDYREKYESDERKGGLKVVEDQNIRQKIAMAVDGYGNVEVTGDRDGKMLKVSTLDNPMSILAPSGENPEEVFPALRETIASFLGRFTR